MIVVNHHCQRLDYEWSPSRGLSYESRACACISAAFFSSLFLNSLTTKTGSLAAHTRSHMIGDHPSGLTKEQTRKTMDHWRLGLGLGFCFRAGVHCSSCLFFC